MARTAERAMYWDSGTGEAGHDSIGMDAAHSTFYLPDGSTSASSGTETWTLVQNPNTEDVRVRISYFMKGGGAPVTFEDTVSGNSRKTYSMAYKLSEQSASIVVECLSAGKKIMCERAMYWNSRGAGTDTIGGYSD